MQGLGLRHRQSGLGKSARRTLLASALLCASALAMPAVHADDFEAFGELHGLGDVRLAFGDSAVSAFDGGFGRTRFGGDGTNGDTRLRINELALVGFAQIKPELSFVAHVQHNPDLNSEVDLVEAFLRYRPVSTSRWQWSFRAGAFFPEVSGEQLGVAWQNLFTLSNNAANTWIAEEVRPIGLDVGVEYRGDNFSARLNGVTYVGNDRSGVGLALRGWQINGQNVGLFGELRLPDLPPGRVGATNSPFVESDGRLSLALGLNIEHDTWGNLHIFASDNKADALEVGSEGRLWPTRYVSVGYDILLPGDIEFFAQVMEGDTYTYPTGDPSVRWFSNFTTASVLLARQFGDFQVALRGELFEQEDRSIGPVPNLDEDGGAITTAVTWFAGEHHQVAAEYLYVDSDRTFGPGGQPLALQENLFQLNYRFVF